MKNILETMESLLEDIEEEMKWQGRTPNLQESDPELQEIYLLKDLKKSLTETYCTFRKDVDKFYERFPKHR